MHKRLILTVFGFLILGALTLSTRVNALTYTYPEYNVDITVNKDSSFDVKETSTYKFYGEAHGLRRDVTLSNPSITQKCLDNQTLTCGGFDTIIPIAVYDGNGKKLGTNEYKTYEIENEDGKRYFRFEWELWSDGKELHGDEVSWSIEYKIIGGIQWIKENPYFYWNALPEERNGAVDQSKVTIKFPSNIVIDKSSFQLYSNYISNLVTSNITHTAVYSFTDLGSYGDVTIAYKFEPLDLKKPGTVNYTINSPEVGATVWLDNAEINSKSTGTIKYFPTGDHSLTFKHVGYTDHVEKINLKEGEVKNLTIELQPELWMQFLLAINWFVFLLGCLGLPLAIVLVYLRYRAKGRDKNMPKTIIPLYSPPTGMRPYLLGSIKDENVDKEDVVGSIIDLAYRGYIKIKEVSKNSNYQLTKLEGKKGDPGLDKIEQKIMDALFGGSDSVETKEFRKTGAFLTEYIKMTHDIYKKMVSDGYFDKNPDTTRGIYVGLGVVLFILGIGIAVVFSIFVTTVIGYISLFTPGVAISLAGVAFMFVAKFMPAKTEKGSKAYADILGFKMYLNTAERYRLQKLGPEEFEKWLSYAIVFKIEKEWAEKFKDIYNTVPDWYEGTGNVYDAIWISSFTRSFANSTINSMNIASSSSGSGWSGSSGSFGGFSGGGGGGGSSGAW